MRYYVNIVSRLNKHKLQQENNFTGHNRKAIKVQEEKRTT